MRAAWVLAVALALGTAGCTDTADLVASNNLAQGTGTPRLYFLRGVPGGVMKIVMADGETLPGTFSIDENPAAIAPGSPGNFAASARGPRTRLTCHGTMIAGHGSAECLGANGAAYHVQL